MTRERLIPAVVLAAVLGVGLIALQRWVAETKFAAIVLIGVWCVVVGVAALLYVAKRPDLRRPVLGTFAAIVVGSVAIGYWTGFRDTKVDEEVVVATAKASGAERGAALAGGAPETVDQPTGGDKRAKDNEKKPTRNGNEDESTRNGVAGNGGKVLDQEAVDAAETAPEPDPPKEAKGTKPKPDQPVALASGRFRGEDGHDGRGIATVVREANGARTLTFTEFDVDPGAKSVVWLTKDETNFDDRVELGNLKGNVGDQQYDIPGSADLRKYDTVVIYCTPFTVRIAVAPLG